MPGTVFVITAPSGTGKTTLLQRLMAADPRLQFSISFTTRPPRPTEIPGKDYFFVSPQEFQRLQDAGALVEWVEQFGFFYGTSRAWVEQTLAGGDVDLVFDVDSRGARAIKDAFPQGTLIFILPPSPEELERRLQRRGNLESGELAQRLARGRSELREAHWFDFIVVNDHLPLALTQLQAVITAGRCRTPYLWPQLASRFSPEPA